MAWGVVWMGAACGESPAALGSLPPAQPPLLARLVLDHPAFLLPFFIDSGEKASVLRFCCASSPERLPGHGREPFYGRLEVCQGRLLSIKSLRGGESQSKNVGVYETATLAWK